jgi:hypothetical protein
MVIANVYIAASLITTGWMGIACWVLGMAWFLYDQFVVGD